MVIYQGPVFPWGYPLQHWPVVRVRRYSATPSLLLVHPATRAALQGRVPVYDLFPREGRPRARTAATPKAVPPPLADGEGTRRNHSLILEGLDRLRRGEPGRALGRFRDASLADLSDPDARYLVAHAAAATGDLGRSLAAFRAADRVAGEAASPSPAPDPARVHGAERLAGLREAVDRGVAADPALAQLLGYLRAAGDLSPR